MSRKQSIARSPLHTLGLLLGLTLLIWCPPRVIAQTSPIPGTADDWQWGYLGFRMLLQEKGLQDSSDLELTLQSPRQSVLVVFGKLDQLTRGEWLRLRRFVAQGGALLVAGEESCQIPGVTRLTQGPAESANELERYEQYSDVLSLPCSGPHPLVQGLKSIVVNKTGWMTTPEDTSLNWTVILRLSGQTTPAAARGQAVLLAGLDPIDEGGVMLISADRSLFSDGMIWHGDNSLLAINAVDLLCRGERRLLNVIESGQLAERNPVAGAGGMPGASDTESRGQRRNQDVATDSEFPGRPPRLNRKPPARLPAPQPDLQTLLQTANAVIDKVQDSNLLNETLRDRPRNMRPLAWLRTSLLILLILAGLWVLYQVFSRRAPSLPQWKSRLMQSLFGVYSSQQLSRNEFGPAAQILCRSLCAEMTGSEYETDWVQLKSRRNAPANSFGLPSGVSKSLDEIVSIAINGSQMYLPRRKFRRLGRTIRDLQFMHRKNQQARAATRPLPRDASTGA